jgi:flagellar assembly factor FliW
VLHPLAQGAEVGDEDVFEFAEGLIGLPGMRRFALVPIPSADPFRLLASLEHPAFGVVVASPAHFVSTYRLELAADDVAPLGLQDPADAQILATVVLPKDDRPLRLNLRGPILLCPRTRRGVQRISRDESHGTLELAHPRTASTA